MINKAEIRICDQCKKEVIEREKMFGGSVFAGWFKLDRIIGGTTLMAIAAQEEWPKDFCCFECLKNYILQIKED